VSRSRLGFAVACLWATVAWAAKSPGGLLAEWNFDEGQGDVARDSSGHGHDAKIYGATWVKQGDGFAISLDGHDDYVDCGGDRALGIAGPITIEAWVRPARQPPGNAVLFGESFSSYLLTYYNMDVGWFVGHGGGPTANSVHTKLNLGEWSHVAATFDGKRIGLWVNGRQAASRKSVVESYRANGHFMIGTKGRPDLPKFKGAVDRVRVYGRALSGEEIVAHFKEEAVEYGFDPTWFRRVKVTPYYYLDRGEVLVEADYKGLQPLDGKGRLEVTLSSKERPDEIIQRQVIDEVRAKAGAEEVTLPCGEIAAGDYVIRVVLQDRHGAYPVEEFRFSYPAKPSPVPPPAIRIAGPLPPKPEPTPFGFKIRNGGGFELTIKGVRYAFRSRISWPDGDFNRLAAADEPFTQGEKSWRCGVQATGKGRYEVKAGGDFYTVQREIEVFPTHVYVKDKYTNITGQDLGLLIYNEMPVSPGQVKTSFLSGRDKRGRQPEMRGQGVGPSVFFTDANTGIGMIPIDDVYVVQAVPYVEWEGAAGVGTEKFALAPGKSYTLEWAVYPTGSGDYYYFINTFRKVEGRIGAVNGAAGFITYGPKNRRQVPTTDFIEKRGLKIGIVHVLSAPADDPELDLEGIEFMDFPKEMELLKEQATAIHQKFPGFKVVLHVAHSLYCTNNPDRFADSKVIWANGQQAEWKASYGHISKARQDKGWTLWIYYPTPGNSFHDALMKSVDVLMDEIGMDGAFMDGFFVGYQGQWSYDTDIRWDGHSAEIDPRTKTIRRKVNSVLLLSQPSMIEFSRKIRDKGGIVIANNTVVTRSIANEKYIIFVNECASGPQLHLAPSVTALRGSSASALTEKAIYLDVLDKLSWGECFLYYNEHIRLTWPSLPAKEFPITFEEIRSGLIRGPERIVTMNSGVYGWPGDRRLHLVHKFDARGAPVAHDYVTTVDARGVRTDLRLATHESAVIEPIPARVQAPMPVNVRVLEYGDPELRMLVNGRGKAVLHLFVGAGYPDSREAAAAARAYHVTVNGKTTTLQEKDGSLSVPLDLDGQVEVVVEAAGMMG